MAKVLKFNSYNNKKNVNIFNYLVIKYLENKLKINEKKVVKKLDYVKSIRIFALYLKNK